MTGVMSAKRFNFPDTVPLRYDDDSNIRVTDSLIKLDILVTCHEMGDTPEDILDGYPSLTLEQINAILGWYFDNRAEADEYIREGREATEKLLQELRSRPESIAFHEKMRTLREQLNKAKT